MAQDGAGRLRDSPPLKPLRSLRLRRNKSGGSGRRSSAPSSRPRPPSLSRAAFPWPRRPRPLLTILRRGEGFTKWAGPKPSFRDVSTFHKGGNPAVRRGALHIVLSSLWPRCLGGQRSLRGSARLYGRRAEKERKGCGTPERGTPSLPESFLFQDGGGCLFAVRSEKAKLVGRELRGENT